MTVTQRILILIYVLSLIRDGECIQIVESGNNDSVTNINTTTLYPVEKNKFLKSTIEQSVIKKTSEKNPKNEVTTWTVNATFANPEDDDNEENTEVPLKINETDKHNCKELRKVEKENYTDHDFKPNLFMFPREKTKLNASKHMFNGNELGENTKERENSKELSDKKFKPSPHLFSYHDTLDDSPLLPAVTYSPPVQTATYYGPLKDQFHPHQQNHHEEFVAFPYNYDNRAPVHPLGHWNPPGLQSKPTVEAPVRIPAGGLYKIPDALNKPSSYADYEDYRQESNDNGKENALKKRANPWKKLLHLVTALLPVGLIVSALTPTVFTIQSQDQGLQHHKRLERRLDSAAFPLVSEECKRRLLCEIHSDHNYQGSNSRYRPKPCYKIRCEDPQAVTRALRWLLSYHRAGDTRTRGFT